MGRRPALLSCFFGRGRRPDAPFVLLLKKQVKCSRKGTVLRSFCFCKKNQKARGACCPDRGMLSMQWKVPQRETRCYFLRCAKSNAKSTRGKPCDLGSKLCRLCFFVTFPALVPKPVCGATRFFGCFEPVQKGCCSTDARPLFFENGML